MMKNVLLVIIGICMYLPTLALTENEVYCYIKKVGIKHADIVFKQAIFESGHFKSHIYKTKQNLFGFRRTRNYLKFKTWQASVDFYKKWQDKYYKNDEEDYYKFLQRKNYSGNKKFNYSKELKHIKIKRSFNCEVYDEE